MIEEKVKNIISKMTLEDKIQLCSGKDFWSTEDMEKYEIPSFFMSDGPHGLRVQKGETDHLGINNSELSTCFPTACTSSAGWDPRLLYEMGRAIGEEAAANEVDVVLGPGANIKRNPLCGRNFEYFSEDPYLTGQLAKSWIQGVQSQGVGTSLKHFAANNQEKDRMMSDSVIDERALREIYLAGFEEAVKEGKPASVMCSYNKINGEFSSDNKKLLTDILRKEWGFDGMVVTDWGAMNDRNKAFQAGCDLEMPSSSGLFDAEVKRAVEEGKVSEKEIDASVARILKTAFHAQEMRGKVQGNAASKRKTFDVEGHHALAKRIAGESAVLLKNEKKMLPLAATDKVALCGAMAETVRYQGAGSSHINPTRLSNLVDSMKQETKNLSYYRAYQLDGGRDAAALEEAMEGIAHADKAILVLGLPDSFESEGYDRPHMRIPDSHLELIEKAAEVQKNIIVLLMGGSPVEMPWISKVQAILNLYLGGQAAGEAAAELLYGRKNPCGKLAETYPVSYKDCSSAETFGVCARQVEYAESIYVGYRYFEKAGLKVRFPFGYGLSYTTFAYFDMQIKKESDLKYTVTCSVKNTGDRAGAETAQLYVGSTEQNLFKPLKELKGFAKVYLNAGEEKRVTFYLDKRSFAHYDVDKKEWEVLGGNYQISIGSSSQDMKLCEKIKVDGTISKMYEEMIPEWYLQPSAKPSVNDFQQIYGAEIKPYAVEKPGHYTMLNTLNDMKENPVIQQIMAGMRENIMQASGGDDKDPNVVFTLGIVMNTPLIRLVQQGGGATPRELMELAVQCANGDMSAVEKLAAMMMS